MRRVGRATVGNEPRKLIAIRVDASLLRQNLFDQLEYRRQVLVLRSSQIEIFLAFLQAVVGIDFIFWNIDAAGIVRVGPAEFLQCKLPFSGQQPVDENLRRIGVGRARRDQDDNKKTAASLPSRRPSGRATPFSLSTWVPIDPSTI